MSTRRFHLTVFKVGLLPIPYAYFNTFDLPHKFSGHNTKEILKEDCFSSVEKA